MSSKLRILIVDDEPLARERIRKLLASAEDVEVVGECSDGRQALEAIRRQTPDLVFLDVQMPELDGFGVIEQIGAERMPAVIFVTAHDKFALRAFDVHALDYLLKPFDGERLRVALQRAKERLRRRPTDDLDQRLAALLADVKSGAKPADRLAVKSNGRVLLLKADEIDWIEAADNYVNLHVGKETHMLRETMSALEERLAPSKFVRISRFAIVNLDRIKELHPMFHGEYTVVLHNGARLNLSRGYRGKLQELLGKEA